MTKSLIIGRKLFENELYKLRPLQNQEQPSAKPPQPRMPLCWGDTPWNFTWLALFKIGGRLKSLRIPIPFRKGRQPSSFNCPNVQTLPTVPD